MTQREQLAGDITDSSVFIESLLQYDFEPRGEADPALNREQVVEYLTDSVGRLPGEEMKVISIIGGAASGKSELADWLVKAFWTQGMIADSIGTDDYNFGDRTWRREHFEGPNPPSPIQKYDFPLLNKHIQDIKKLKDGETLNVPVYDEKTGWARDAAVWPHKVGKVGVLIVQGDFHPVDNPDMSVYLHLPDEQRLKNRMRRDANHREKDEQAVIDIFKYRQGNQHFPYTLPQAEEADMIIVADASGASWEYSLHNRKSSSA